MDPELRQVLEEVAAAWHDAEGALKVYELDNSELLTPAINELRYAGTHMIRAIAESSVDEAKKAKRHCNRARYDALEGSLMHLLNYVHKFREDYRFVDLNVVQGVLPDYLEHLGTARSAKATISRIRADERFREVRGEYYAEIQPNIDSLRTVVDKLEVAAPFLAEAWTKTLAQTDDAAKKDATNLSLTTYGVVAGGGALALAAVQFIFNMLK